MSERNNRDGVTYLCNWCGTGGLIDTAAHVCQGTRYGIDPQNIYAGRFENFRNEDETFDEAETTAPGKRTVTA